MVAHGRVELLAHPLSQKYLQMKWHSYGKYFHLADLLFYSIYLLFVTVYSYLLMITTDPSTIERGMYKNKCSIEKINNSINSTNGQNSSSRDLRRSADFDAGMSKSIQLLYFLEINYFNFVLI